jgi:HAD superfamily hydrolase (TIGR01484 family)
MVKMIIMDLDGTLLTDDKKIPNYTLSILEKCKNNDIRIGIATARSERSAKKFIDLLKPDIMILNGGALAINKEREIMYKKFLSEETSDGIIKECGTGIAMENGIEEIKKAAKHICGNNNEDGIGKWIEKNLDYGGAT